MSKIGHIIKKNIIFHFLEPKLPKNHVLFDGVGLTIEKIIHIMANGGHFEFGPPMELSHTYERGMSLVFYSPFTKTHFLHLGNVLYGSK